MPATLDTINTVLEILVYAVAICAALAAVLPKSNAPWRKFLDAIAMNLGNAKNAASAVSEVPAPPAVKRWQDKIKR